MHAFELAKNGEQLNNCNAGEKGEKKNTTQSQQPRVSYDWVDLLQM